MNREDAQLVLGALDSLGCALAEHDHQWTEGERTIYEQAVGMIEEAISSDDCKETDLSASKKCFPARLFAALRRRFDRVLNRLRGWACFALRVVLSGSLLIAFSVCPCFGWIYSWREPNRVSAASASKIMKEAA